MAIRKTYKIIALSIASLVSIQSCALSYKDAFSSVKSFVSKHPWLSAVAGVATIAGLWSTAHSINEWRQNVAPRADLAKTKLPIVYSHDYNFNLFYIEKLYWFDAKKYGKIYNYLVNRLGIPKSCFYTPEQLSLETLAKVHHQEYLDALSGEQAAKLVSSIIEFPIHYVLSSESIRNRILAPMKLATSGTVQATELALANRTWAINLSGGYHHAKGTGCCMPVDVAGNRQDEGGGFCVYADIPLAIEKAWEKNNALKVLIVDLDAHQGNGHEAYFAKEVAKGGASRIAIFDMYCDNNYPRDHKARKSIKYNYPLATGIKDARYLSILTNNLPKAIAEFKPDLIVYNAGTDIFEKDPLGHMSITEQGIIERDAFVFAQAKQNNVPIVMVLSGGYTKDSSRIIGKSIENVLKNIYFVL